MAFLSNQTRKFAVVGAFAAAAAAAPVLALSGLAAGPEVTVEAKTCLAWFGNKEDGNCMSYSEGNGVAFGTPGAGLCGGGICTSPILPGNSWNTSIGIG
ncbi:DUF7155 family protein [Mycobacterium sp. C31M]